MTPNESARKRELVALPRLDITTVFIAFVYALIGSCFHLLGGNGQVMVAANTLLTISLIRSGHAHQ